MSRRLIASVGIEKRKELSKGLVKALGLLLVAGFSFGLAASDATNKEPYMIGTAYKPGTEEVLYVEKYYWLTDFLSLVEYYDKEDEILARKTINYSQKKNFSPDILIEDYRLKRRVSVMHGPDKCQLVVEDANTKKLIDSATHPAENHEVTDAGFDNYLRAQWRFLETGKAAKFSFLMTDEDKIVALKARQRSCESQSGQGDSICFRISPANWFVSALAPPIDVEYDAKARKLLRYEGIGLLRDINGISLKVDLRYHYL
ncbi:MAG: hypothetical protein AB8B86_01515 [Pseudomonadales bacterium]